MGQDCPHWPAGEELMMDRVPEAAISSEVTEHTERTEDTGTTVSSTPQLLHGELTESIRQHFIQVYWELGYGFLESVYSAALGCALMESGLSVEREVPLAVNFRGIRVGSFRADMIVESKVLLELKAGVLPDPNSEAQILN